MVSESGAAFHVNSPLGDGVGDLETKRSWWRQYWTNETFLKAYPGIKLISMFEFMKFEEKFASGVDDLRDFRISNKTEIRTPFLQDLEPVKGMYTFATTGGSSNSAQSVSTISVGVLAIAIGLLF